MTLTLEKAIVRERHVAGSSWWEVVYPDGKIDVFVGETAEGDAIECANRWNEQYVTGNMVMGGYSD